MFYTRNTDTGSDIKTNADISIFDTDLYMINIEHKYKVATSRQRFAERKFQGLKNHKGAEFAEKSYPYMKRMQSIYKQLENTGMDRFKIIMQYQKYIDTGKSAKNFSDALETNKVDLLFRQGKVEDIEKIIEQRLNKNSSDIIAQLIRFDLDITLYRSEDLLDTAENIILLLSSKSFFEKCPHAIAILNFIVMHAEAISYTSNISVEKKSIEREKTHEICLQLKYIIADLEKAGFW